MYDPKQGRFLQRDPLGYVDGMNLYKYVGNSLGDWVDPAIIEGRLNMVMVKRIKGSIKRGILVEGMCQKANKKR